MPTTEQLRSRLLKKLKELFQLDQPDLDFGFYRIMHAKARQVTEFIEKDLLKIVEDAFGHADGERKAALKAEYEKAVETAQGYGAPDPENTPLVRDVRAKYLAAAESASGEADIYDHLFRFFERYYDDGDFISRRYYARETEGRAAPFAIPYSGEEVKLHWANADQYYIKTAEYFTNYTFDLSRAAQIQAEKNGKEKVAGTDNLFGDVDPAIPDGLRVHFRIVEATEGEHGNIKAGDATKRYFIIHREKPVELDDTGALTVNFEYRPDPEKTGQEGTWKDKRNAESVATVLASLKTAADDEKKYALYLRLFSIPAPTENDRKRPLLAKCIGQYTARNTMDYFIHKDLGIFLKRELDFYIKNEVMRLDDIENAEAPAVEGYLTKIRVLRKIAGKLIDFLAQLENFQKKLWLKKKFVVETNYCITLDRVPGELYPEIAANEAQREEWVKLFAIDEIEGDLATPGYDVPLTVEFLKANDKLMVDTKFFGEDFRAKLIASIEDFDEQCDGLLIHSENFQALNLLKKRCIENVKCIHIDPPYNTATSGFLYKNDYQHASWLTMMESRIGIGLELLAAEGSYLCHIDENEYERLYLLFNHFPIPNAGTIAWDKRNPMNAGRGIATQHEYIVWRSWQNAPLYLRNDSIVSMLKEASEIIARHNGVNAEAKKKYAFWVEKNTELTGGEKAYRYLDEQGRIYQSVSLRAPEPRTDPKFHTPLIHPISKKPCPVPPNGFSRTPETLQTMIEKEEIIFGKDETIQPRQKVILKQESKRQVTSVIQDGRKGKGDLDRLGVDFPYCHPVALYEELVAAGTGLHKDLILDYFAGSGTTGHAVINLNREDGGRRKYILVEMGDYFDTVLKPRIAKVVYSSDWKGGKPTTRNTGISHCFKYLRLESYEDTLNNLLFDDDPLRIKAITASPTLKEDYMLHYLLDVETKGSQSLLNIDAFRDPGAYTLKVKKPGSDEYGDRTVDVLETFNYLIGLRVVHIAEPQAFTAAFIRTPDPELPEDQHTKLVLDGKLRQDSAGPWWFRKVEGWVPKDRQNSNNGQKERVLIVWRKLTDDLEKDNLMLDEWFEKNRISTRDFEFDTIFVNGSNNLPNLQKEGDTWKVRLIEEEFMKRMWDIEEV